MDFDINGGIDAVKKVVTNYALPMIVGAFVVAMVAGLLGKKL